MARNLYYVNSSWIVLSVCDSRISSLCQLFLIFTERPSCNKDNCSVDLSKQYSVDGECVVCYNKKQMVLIEPCNHVTVCVDCINMM